MDAGLKMEIVQDKFNAMLAELAAIDPTIEFADVIKSEAASVMKGALSATRVASAGAIRARQESKEWTTFNGKKYRFAVWRLERSTFSGIKARNRESLQTKLAARGLAKQSWMHAAASFGKTIEAVGFVGAANYRSRQYPQDGASTATGGGSAYELTVVNSSPIVQAAGGWSALQRAMNGRVSYFQRNMEHHAFRTVETRARAYPGIFTSTVPPAAD